MHQPTKRGAVLKPDIPSDGKLIQVRSAPMWDDQEQVYKMLYRPYPKNSPHRYSAALALSKDGIHWEKPRLGEVELDGSKDNNHIDIASLGRSKLWNVVIAPDAPDPRNDIKDSWRILSFPWSARIVSIGASSTFQQCRGATSPS